MSLLARVAVIIAAALLPTVCIQVLNEAAWQTARQVDVRSEALRDASEVAAGVNRIIDEARGIMMATARFPAVRDGDPAGCGAVLASLGAGLPFLRDLRLLASDGHPVCSSGEVADATSLSSSQEAATQQVAGTFSLQGLRVRRSGGSPALAASYILPEDGGRSLHADIDLDWLTPQLAALDLPPGSQVTVADRDGMVLVGFPDRSLVGKKLPSQWRQALAAPTRAVVDGVGGEKAGRVDAYVPPATTQSGLFAGVEFASAPADLQAGRASLRSYLTSAAGFLVALALAAWLTRGAVTRPLLAILATTERWSKGDTTARVKLTGPRSEFGRMAQAVNALLDAVMAAQARLGERLAELAAVYHAAPVGLGFIDRDMRYVTVNPTLAEIDGIKEDAHRGQSTRGLLHDSSRDLQALLRRALAGERIAPVEVLGGSATATGSQRRLLISFQPAVAEGGEVLGAIMAVQDVTDSRRAEAALQETLQRANVELERRMAQRTAELEAEVREREATQAQLQQAQKMEVVGQLTGGVAHDFNNLLTAVIGNLELAGMRSQDRPDLARLLQAAMRAAERGAALTQRMLAFGRRQYLRFQPVPLPALLEGMADLLARTIGPRVDIRIEAPASLRTARADPNQLELVILNLVVNARDAMPDGGVVTIAAAEEHVSDPALHIAGLPSGDYIRLSVHDSGTGMAPETIAHAFEPFFTTKPVGRGSGLGLSMVQGVALQSGGGASIDSALGEGTTITLWLPCADAQPEAAAPQRPQPPRPVVAHAAGGRTVLLADDDSDVLSFATACLEEAGYLVECAASGEAALALLHARSLPPDLLIADLAMPGMNGLDLAAAARETFPGMPVLIATGYYDGSSDGGGGDPPILGKPFKGADLLARVAELVRHSEQHGAAVNHAAAEAFHYPVSIGATGRGAGS